MVNGPGLYSEFGKKAKDVLYKDYTIGRKLFSRNLGVALTVPGKLKNITLDLTAGADSELFSITVDESALGFKSILHSGVSGESFYKLEHQMLLQNAGISVGADMSENPIVDVSCAIGNATFGLGSEFSFNTASESFTKFNVGLNYTNAFLAASLNLKGKGRTLEASFYRDVNSETKTAVGVEMIHNMVTKKNTLALGAQHVWDPFTIVKARINNHGIAGGLVQYRCSSKTLVTLSGELRPSNQIRLGLGLSFTPNQ